MYYYGYIYKTTNLINGMIYVGQKKGKFNKKYIGSGRYLKCAVNKYGKNNFRVDLLEYGVSKDYLNTIEKIFIKGYRNLFGKTNMYNISDGGSVSGFLSDKLYTNRKIHTNPDCMCCVCRSKRGQYIGKNNPIYNTKWIYNIKSNTALLVQKNEIDSYIRFGWKLGNGKHGADKLLYYLKKKNESKNI